MQKHLGQQRTMTAMDSHEFLLTKAAASRSWQTVAACISTALQVVALKTEVVGSQELVGDGGAGDPWCAVAFKAVALETFCAAQTEIERTTRQHTTIAARIRCGPYIALVWRCRCTAPVIRKLAGVGVARRIDYRRRHTAPSAIRRRIHVSWLQVLKLQTSERWK